MRRPGSGDPNQRGGVDGSSYLRQQQQPAKTQQQREEEYRAARERIIGNQQQQQQQQQQGIANSSPGIASNPGGGAAAGYIANGPIPGRGRGFNITNPGRGLANGRGAAGRGAPPPQAAPPRANGIGKAVYRDRERDVSDPDYRRGVNRYQQRFDPGFNSNAPAGGIYITPSYNSEVRASVIAALARVVSGKWLKSYG